MLTLVLRYRLKLWTRSLRSRSGRLKLGPGAGVGVYILIAAGIALYAGAITGAVRRINPGAETGLLYLPAAGITIMTLLGGISVSLNELYVASDMELLLTTPLSEGSLFLLKLLDSSLPAWPTAGWWLSAVMGYAVALGLGLGFVVVALLAAFLLATVMVAMALILVLLLARVLPPKRLREGIVLASSVIGISVWLGWIALNRRSGGSDIAANLTALDSRLRWTPIGWAHSALAHAQFGEAGLAFAGLALLALLAAALGVCAYGLFAGVYLTTWSATREAAPALRRRNRQPAVAAPSRSAALSMALKDWRTVRRDVPFLSSLLPTLIYALIYPFLLLRIGGGSSVPGRWAGLIGLPIVPFMAASTLGLSAIAREGKSFEVLRASPVSAWNVMLGKIATVWIPVAALTVAAGLALAAYHHAPAGAFAVAGVGGLWLALGFAVLGVAVGSLNPDFEAKPGRRAQGVRGPGCFLYGALGLLFGGASALAVFVIVAAVLHRLGGAPFWAAAIVAAVLAGVAYAPVGVIAVVGLSRLARLLGPEA